jgi:tRNA G18 (ribose-2'-O)-methylase SpoU
MDTGDAIEGEAPLATVDEAVGGVAGGMAPLHSGGDEGDVNDADAVPLDEEEDHGSDEAIPTKAGSKWSNEFTEQIESELGACIGAGYQHHRYLVICHISKINNVKTLLQSAAAFGFVPIIVGMQEIQKGLQHDRHLALSASKYLYFNTLKEALSYFQSENIKLIAVEIGEEAQNVMSNTLFTMERIAFMLGNEGSGLNRTQREAANGFIYIPQYGNGTASLNVSVAAAVMLNRYYLWTVEQTT